MSVFESAQSENVTFRTIGMCLLFGSIPWLCCKALRTILGVVKGYIYRSGSVRVTQLLSFDTMTFIWEVVSSAGQIVVMTIMQQSKFPVRW